MLAGVDVHGMAAGVYELLVQASVSSHPTPDDHTASGTLTIGPAQLTITAGSHTKVYGEVILASLFGSLTFSGADQTSPVAGSPYAITPGGLSSTNYAITFVPGSLTVTPASLTIAVNDGTKLYTGFVLGEDAAVLGGSLAFVGAGQSSPVSGSPYTITASGLSSTNYAITYQPGKLTVSPTPLTVAADVLNTVYGQTPLFSASYTGFVLGEGPSVLGGTLAFTSDASATAPVSGSPYVITVGGLSSTNYDISFVGAVDFVSPAAVTLTPANIRPVTYGSGTITLSAKLLALPPSAATVGQGQAVLTIADANGRPIGSPVSASVTNGTASATFPLDAGVGAGSYTIQASYSDTLPVPNFASVASATAATFQVLPAPLTITADDQTTIYGAPLPAFTASYAGFVFGQTPSVLTGTLSLTSPATQLSPVAGSPYPITPSGLSSPNYAITYVPGKLAVRPADVGVTSSDVSVVYGVAGVTLQATIAASSPSAASVNEGTVTFTASDSHGATVSTLTSGTVSAGAMTVTLPLPSTAYAGVYAIAAVYGDAGASPNFNAAGAQPVTLTINNPVPVITSLSPTSVQAGTGGTVAIAGTGFVPGSVIHWNGASLAATFVSSTQVSVSIPPQAQTGAIDVAIVNSGPGGGASNGTTFFFTPSGVQAKVASGTSTDPQGKAVATVGGPVPFSSGTLSGEAVGSGTLTVAQFNANPVASPVFGPEGGWFDMHVSSGNSFSLVVIVDCNLGAGHAVFWWTGSAWQRMSNQSWSPTTGCITIVVDNTTSPTIAQLNGTEAEVWGWAQSIGLDPCIGFQFEGVYGRLPNSIPELDSWGNSVHLRDPNTGNWSCSPQLAPPGDVTRTDTGQSFSWDSIDSQLIGAGYPGPYDHGSAEIAAYQNACHCTLIVSPPPPADCTQPGVYITINGARRVDQMRAELHAANYPNWQWASDNEIISVYARTTGGVVNLCSTSSPQPPSATPTPTPLPGSFIPANPFDWFTSDHKDVLNYEATGTQGDYSTVSSLLGAFGWRATSIITNKYAAVASAGQYVIQDNLLAVGGDDTVSCSTPGCRTHARLWGIPYRNSTDSIQTVSTEHCSPLFCGLNPPFTHFVDSFNDGRDQIFNTLWAHQWVRSGIYVQKYNGGCVQQPDGGCAGYDGMVAYQCISSANGCAVDPPDPPVPTVLSSSQTPRAGGSYVKPAGDTGVLLTVLLQAAMPSGSRQSVVDQPQTTADPAAIVMLGGLTVTPTPTATPTTVQTQLTSTPVPG